MTANKVQKNEHNVNVLVESENSSNRHYWHGNFNVEIEKVLTDKEISEMFSENVTKDELLSIAKDWIKKQNDYAVSNVTDEVLGIKNNSIIKFKKIINAWQK